MMTAALSDILRLKYYQKPTCPGSNFCNPEVLLILFLLLELTLL